MIKKIDNYFFYENINHYTNIMTGRSINAQQSQGFLSTMHTLIDDLDSISSAIDDNTYLRLVNGLQRLYTIHNSLNQSPTSVIENTVQRHNERYHENFQDNNEVQIAMVIAQHYDLINDISGNPINAINTINSDNANNQNNHRMHWIEAALREGITRA